MLILVNGASLARRAAPASRGSCDLSTLILERCPDCRASAKDPSHQTILDPIPTPDPQTRLLNRFKRLQETQRPPMLWLRGAGHLWNAEHAEAFPCINGAVGLQRFGVDILM